MTNDHAAFHEIAVEDRAKNIDDAAQALDGHGLVYETAIEVRHELRRRRPTDLNETVFDAEFERVIDHRLIQFD